MYYSEQDITTLMPSVRPIVLGPLPPAPPPAPTQAKYPHEMYHAEPLVVRGLTCEQAFAQARSEMCALYEPWCTASNAEIQRQICAVEGNIYPEPSAVRMALCGSYAFPAPQPWPCQGVTNGGSNTMLLLGLAGIAAVGVVAVAIASKGKKKVLVARPSS